jgi:hypothetical protein
MIIRTKAGDLPNQKMKNLQMTPKSILLIPLRRILTEDRRMLRGTIEEFF